jgi:hypothetical protein
MKSSKLGLRVQLLRGKSENGDISADSTGGEGQSREVEPSKRLWGRMLSGFLRGKGDSYAVQGASQEVSLCAQPGVDKMQRVRAGHSDGS